MGALTDRLVGFNDMGVFHMIGYIPVHPGITQSGLDADIIINSIDPALAWTHEYLKQHPEKIPSQAFLSQLRTRDRQNTKDIGVLEAWLKEPHTYSRIVDGVVCDTDDVREFPIGGLSIGRGKISFAGYIIMPDQDRHHVSLEEINFLGYNKLLNDDKREELGIMMDKDTYYFPKIWYIKPGIDIYEIFGRNFAMQCNNRFIEKKYSTGALVTQ